MQFFKKEMMDLNRIASHWGRVTKKNDTTSQKQTDENDVIGSPESCGRSHM